jgi:hypothetical protein
MRSIAIRVAVFLILGAAVNVAVAWGCASLSAMGPADSLASSITFSYGQWLMQIEREAGFGRERLGLAGSLGPFRVDTELRSVSPADSWRAPPAYEAVPSWSRLGPARSGAHRMVDAEEAAGWPLKSMWAAVVESRGQGWITLSSTAIHFAGWTTPMADGTVHSQRLLPLLPIWRGFAINTFLYSAILALLFYPPRVIRRAIRARRGLCTSCGYDLRGAAHERCPECGALVPCVRCASP